MIGGIAKGAEWDQAADPGSSAKATLNILDDFGEEEAQLQDTQKAILNILEDAGTQKLRLEAAQKATLNILADFSDEKARLAEVQKAILNILEDFAGEKARLESTQKAILNILEDFDAEKNKVAHINREMAKEIAERKKAEQRQAVQHAVTRVLAESATLSEANPRILRSICEGLRWDLGELWSLDRHADVLRCEETWLLPTVMIPALEKVTRQIAFPRGVGLPGRVWASGEPAWIPDVTQDSNFPRASAAAEDGVHGAFGFPTRLGNDVLGVLCFYHREIRQPANDLLQMFAAIGSQIGQFIKRKRAEEEIIHLNEDLQRRATELEAANKELEAFSYTVSHDLRAPLRGIDGFTRALHEDYGDRLDGEGRRYLENVQAAARRMDDLIEDLLKYSRLERRAIRRGRVALEALLERILEDRRTEIEVRQLTIRPQLATPHVEGEPEGLREAIANLVDNAIKFSKPGGSITVSSDVVDRLPSTGTGTAAGIPTRGAPDPAAGAGYVLIAVQDEGIGFDMKYHDRIFEIFQRLHRTEEYEGTGVGLAIVKKVAERHAGRAWAVSELGKGSVFYLGIPT